MDGTGKLFENDLCCCVNGGEKRLNMNKINILYSMVCRDFHDFVIRNLRKALDIGKEIAITELHECELHNFCNTYECCDAYYGQYYKYEEYEKCPAVDDYIIDKMSPYALEILKMMDRKQSWDMNFEDRMQLYFEHIKFWDYVLDYYEINRVVFFNVPHEVFDYVIYCLCKVKNIRMSILYGCSPFPNRFLVFNDLSQVANRLGELISKYQEKYRGQAIDEIELSSKCQYTYDSYVRITQEKDSKTIWDKRAWKGANQKEVLKYMAYMDVRHMIEKKYEKKTDGKTVTKELNKRLNEKRILYSKPFEIFGYFRTKALWDCYESLAEIPERREKYVLFCMHYCPEATVSPMGGGIYSNQLIPITLLANNLPRGVKLYVKEHPNQAYVGKTKSLYNNIRKIKNVRLISQKCNQYKLIKESIATASLTGTVAIESVMLGKPCILFGRYVYNYMEGVFHVRKNEECKKAVECIMNKNFSITPENIKIFFKSLYEYSYVGNVGYGRYNAVQNAKYISDVLLDDIKKEKKE